MAAIQVRVTVFRNVMNEWYARDSSRKIRSIFNARMAEGKHCSGSIPYGFLHDKDDLQASPKSRYLF
jgi:hypothetical protein